MKKIHKGMRAYGLSHISWKSYNLIKKKAMEQEFSLAGLTLSLSIAFFVSIGSAQALNLAYQSTMNESIENLQTKQKIYQVEVLPDSNNYFC